MVYDNKLSGTMPTELGLLSDNLWRLDVGVNRIGGSLPSELGDLRKLSFLYLQENQFQSTFPNEIGPRIQRLQDVWLYNNEFTGTLPTGLGNHTRITSILAHGNGFRGNVSQTLCNNEILWEMTEFTADCFASFVRCDCCLKCY
jgi:Leucine-rich repeat (LRR) protein